MHQWIKRYAVNLTKPEDWHWRQEADFADVV